MKTWFFNVVSKFYTPLSYGVDKTIIIFKNMRDSTSVAVTVHFSMRAYII